MKKIKFSSLVIFLIGAVASQVRAEPSIWPPLTLGIGNTKYIGDIGEQFNPSWEVGVQIWGPQILEPNLRTGYFGFEFGSSYFNNEGTRFFGAGQKVYNSSTAFIPWVRVWGDDVKGMVMLGAGFKANSLNFYINNKYNSQTLASYLFGVQYLKQLNEKWGIGAKLTWSSIDERIMDKYYFIEATEMKMVVSFSP